jgi:hypothetical protein
MVVDMLLKLADCQQNFFPRSKLFVTITKASFEYDVLIPHGIAGTLLLMFLLLDTG